MISAFASGTWCPERSIDQPHRPTHLSSPHPMRTLYQWMTGILVVALAASVYWTMVLRRALAHESHERELDRQAFVELGSRMPVHNGGNARRVAAAEGPESASANLDHFNAALACRNYRLFWHDRRDGAATWPLALTDPDEAWMPCPAALQASRRFASNAFPDRKARVCSLLRSAVGAT